MREAIYDLFAVPRKPRDLPDLVYVFVFLNFHVISSGTVLTNILCYLEAYILLDLAYI